MRSVRWGVRDAVVRLGVQQTEAFRVEQDYEDAWRTGTAPKRPPSGEFERRKANWPVERDRLPRPAVIHLIKDSRPELEYSAEPAELTRSLDRIREWLAKANLKYPTSYQPGLTQGEISELAKKLPYILTEELCELYRWADGTTDGNGFLIYYDFFKPLKTALEHDYQMMCDLNDRQYPGTWKKKWFPVFNEGPDWWIQELSKEPAKHGPMISFYISGGEPERRYRSLTEMMFAWAECYERGAFLVDGEGHLKEDQARFEEIHREILGRRWRN
jgi:cell wall assembly regulator SMI1